MASFYTPIRFDIQNIPTIIYPCSGLEKVFDRNQEECIEQHLLNLYQENTILLKGDSQYHVIILWTEKNSRMTDIWIHAQLESWGSGPLVDAKIFRNFTPELNIGVSAGDGLIMLGREEEHRRKKATFEEFLNGDRPVLPEGLNATENLYILY